MYGYMVNDNFSNYILFIQKFIASILRVGQGKEPIIPVTYANLCTRLKHYTFRIRNIRL